MIKILTKIFRSFTYAFNGLKIGLSGELNLRVHFLSAIAAISLGLFFHISKAEWLALLLVIGLVISTELMNTALEHLADFVSPEKHPKIKIVKDLAAAAVTIAAIIALVIGVIIFLPKITQ
ncbi:diacylglycerol kinase family protein [Pelobium sp.]|nr:diacylglycerol kinase family protein [Pelobium sp.]MDA9554868.1 diacylglycerol kinase family protein [Pelobium sp.]